MTLLVSRMLSSVTFSETCVWVARASAPRQSATDRASRAQKRPRVFFSFIGASPIKSCGVALFHARLCAIREVLAAALLASTIASSTPGTGRSLLSTAADVRISEEIALQSQPANAVTFARCSDAGNYRLEPQSDNFKFSGGILACRILKYMCRGNCRVRT